MSATLAITMSMPWRMLPVMNSATAAVMESGAVVSGAGRCAVAVVARASEIAAARKDFLSISETVQKSE